VNIKVKRILPFLVSSALLCTVACNPSGSSKGDPKTGGKEEAVKPIVVTGPVGKPGAIYPLYRKGKWGYVDSTGKFVIEPQFLLAYRFAEDVAPVANDKNKWGYINREGKFEIEPKYDGAGPFSEGHAMVILRNQAGIINRKGAMVVEPRFARIGLFHDGLAPAVVIHDSINGTKVPEGGYIDFTGKFVIPAQFDPGLTAFNEGVAGVRRLGQMWSFIDRNDKIVIKPAYFQLGQFSEGMAAFMNEASLWGFIDRSGKVVITPKFSGVKVFGEDLCAVRTPPGKLWGFINRSGALVIKEQFDNAERFVDGMAMVSSEGKVGYIDKSGKYVIPLAN
jgi:hypothetical protein